MSHRTCDRVDRARHCVVCGRPDWCLRAPDGSAAICARVEEGSVRRVGGAGWLHRLRDDGWQPTGCRRVLIPSRQPRATRGDLAELAEEYRLAVTHDRLAQLSVDLGVSIGSLNRLRVGWCESSRAWSFAMVDHSGAVLGIRLRTGLGRKFAVKGSHDGLFVPDGLDGSGPLLIAEGPTDTLALISLGFDAVGRPSCRGGTKLLLDLVGAWRPRSVVVVSDNDPGGQGRDGALELAGRCRLRCRDVRLISPPEGIKDARAWVRSGARRPDLLRVIEATRPARVAISCRPVEAARAGEVSRV
jgi:hypothetical protein